VNCSSCGHDNPAQAKFCLECGGRFSSRCGQCKIELPREAKFCLECGKAVSTDPLASAPDPRSYTPKHLAEKILTSRSVLEGERKQVTVLT
jgi:hypothetical protein